MSTAKPVVLAALVADHERPLIIAAAKQLSYAVARATGARWPIRLRFFPLANPRIPPGAIIVTSLAIDFAARWTAKQRDVYWRTLLTASHSGCIFLCTLFRHVDDRRAVPEQMERIRQLNLFAIRLSRTANVALIDLDRLFALHGARALAEDQDVVVALGAQELAEAIIATGLDHYVAPEVQRGAAAALVRSPLALREREEVG